MRRIYNERLIIKKRDFVEHNENKPLLTLTFLPMTTKMLVTNNDQELHLMSESYSCEEEHSRKRRRRSPSGRGVGTNVMKKALI